MCSSDLRTFLRDKSSSSRYAAPVAFWKTIAWEPLTPAGVAAFARATSILSGRRDALDRGVALLLERETIAGEELANFLDRPAGR